MDYIKVREDQQAAALEWETTHFRIEDQRVKHSVFSNPEDTSDPNERILKRSVLSSLVYQGRFSNVLLSVTASDML
jgi:hypothetical protein